MSPFPSFLSFFALFSSAHLVASVNLDTILNRQYNVLTTINLFVRNISMNLALQLTERELTELRERTKVTDSAEAVTRAAREFLRIYRLRELTSMATSFEYDESAWRELDEAELNQPELSIDLKEPHDG